MQSVATRLTIVLARPSGVHTATMIKAKISPTCNESERLADRGHAEFAVTTRLSGAVSEIKFFDSVAIIRIYLYEMQLFPAQHILMVIRSSGGPG